MTLPINYTELDWVERRDVRNEYIKIQNNLCSHCKNVLTESPPPEITSMKINKKLFPPNFFKYPIHLHHNHDTGMTIGAVHNYCNAVLWEYHGE